MNRNIFRSYDIRGIYGKDLDEELFEKIGNAFAQFSPRDILVARDQRLTSESLLNAFMRGSLEAEKTVMNIGEMPLSVATDWAVSQQLDLAYITASHLGKEWNGVKFFHHNGMGFSEKENFELRDMVEEGKLFHGLRATPVREEREDVLNLYVDHIISRFPKLLEKPKMKILVDCGNGTAGIIVQRLFSKAGFDVDMIFEKPDGNFPNRLSDPSEDPLQEMKKRIGKYDFGIAYDGDADRFVVMSKSGHKLPTEHVAHTVLSQLLKEKNGPIVANVECSMLLEDIAKQFNSQVIRCPVGHTFLIEAVSKNKAVFGMEFAGHYAMPILSGFDDAIAVSLYFAYAVHKLGKLEDILKEVKLYHFARVDFPCADESKFDVIEKIKSQIQGEINDMDGVRKEFDDAWVLVRAANTSPFVRLTIEAKDKEKFEQLKEEYSQLVREFVV